MGVRGEREGGRERGGGGGGGVLEREREIILPFRSYRMF